MGDTKTFKLIRYSILSNKINYWYNINILQNLQSILKIVGCRHKIQSYAQTMLHFYVYLLVDLAILILALQVLIFTLNCIIPGSIEYRITQHYKLFKSDLDWIWWYPIRLVESTKKKLVQGALWATPTCCLCVI